MEVIYLDCGARRPQLKRNPLDGCGQPMQVTTLLEAYHLLILGHGPEAVVAELRHVLPMQGGGRVETPIGYIAAAPVPAEPEAAAHWRAELFLRSDVPQQFRDPRLPDAVLDWLLAETACVPPVLLNVNEGKSISFVQRGEISGDE